MFWDRVAGVYDLFANHINRRANEALCAAVAEEIRPEDEVLECACGTGLLSGVIAERCRSLEATDLSERMLQVARRQLGSRPCTSTSRTSPLTRWWRPTSSTF